jgi:hypothetical protein
MMWGRRQAYKIGDIISDIFYFVPADYLTCCRNWMV